MAEVNAVEKQPVTQEYLKKMDAYWRAANYLGAAQLYLLDNPLLREPLTMDHIKKKIVGHWGTVPGQNFVYVHLNRVIKKYDQDMILISGPGHGGNFFVANTYLEGTYSEVYPNIGEDMDGLKKLCKQFSFPGGISSHVAPETPGSINEGGELGYSLAHSFGAVFDNPDLVAACIVGDGESETGPLATSWQCNKFLNPKTDGAVLPILHLNGYKISNPTILARISREELEHFFDGCGWKPYFVEGDEPMDMHSKMAAALDQAMDEIKAIQKNLDHYHAMLECDGMGEQQKRFDGTPIERAEIERWIEDAEERLESEISRLCYYQSCIDDLGGVQFSKENIKPGYVVKIKHYNNCTVLRTGPKNIIYRTPNGFDLTAAYAEILEIVKAEETIKPTHPFKVGETFEVGAYVDGHRVKQVWEIVKSTATTVTLKNQTTGENI